MSEVSKLSCMTYMRKKKLCTNKGPVKTGCELVIRIPKKIRTVLRTGGTKIWSVV
jgi:hypothetical protein